MSVISYMEEVLRLNAEVAQLAVEGKTLGQVDVETQSAEEAAATDARIAQVALLVQTHMRRIAELLTLAKAVIVQEEETFTLSLDAAAAMSSSSSSSSLLPRPMTKEEIDHAYRNAKAVNGAYPNIFTGNPRFDPNPRALQPPTTEEVAELKAFVDSGGLHRMASLTVPPFSPLPAEPSPSPPPMKRSETAPTPGSK